MTEVTLNAEKLIKACKAAGFKLKLTPTDYELKPIKCNNQESNPTVQEVLHLAEDFARHYQSINIPTGQLYKGIAHSNTERAREKLRSALEKLQTDKNRIDWMEKNFTRAAYKTDVGEVLCLWPGEGSIRMQVDLEIEMEQKAIDG